MKRAIFLLLSCVVALPAAPAVAALSAVERLEQAVAKHPDDRDLSWAYVRALHESGRRAQAATRLRRQLERWPGHPPEGALLLGRWLYELHRDEDAVVVLEAAMVEHPGSASGQLTLGLALKRVGRLPEALQRFEMAAALDTSLAGEALLLAALARLELGDESGGGSLLRRVVSLDPDGEAARSARLVLEGVATAESSRLRLEAYAGTEFDSNVTLESNESQFPGASSDETDLRFSFGTLSRLRAFSGERVALDLGARYDGSRHLEQHDYDSDRFTGFLSGRYALRSDLALRLDAWGGTTRLDGKSYLVSASARPSLFLTIGERIGVISLFAEGERVDYDEEPPLSAFERTGWAYGGGLEHYVPIRVGEETAWFSIGASFSRRDTEAERDPLLGFSGDYDHDRWRATLRSHLPLPWQLRAILEVGFDAERYANPNLTGFLSELSDDERSDDVWTAGLTLSRPVSRFVDLELAWRFTDRASNLALFSYDRHVVGLSIRAHTP